MSVKVRELRAELETVRNEVTQLIDQLTAVQADVSELTAELESKRQRSSTTPEEVR